MSRRPFQPTEEQRKHVQALAGFGVPHDDIALTIDIAPKTLRKHFRRELDLGVAKANAQIGRSLFQQATSGNTAAAIFWAKARMGWREKQDTGSEEGNQIIIKGGLPDAPPG